MGHMFAKTKYDSSDSSDSDDFEDCEEYFSNSVESISDETTDAAVKPMASLPRAQDVITVEKVRSIERQLDVNEIISLAYLLLEESTEIEFQLQRILLLLSGSREQVLSLWAEYHSHKNNDWQNKFVEALCTIKNYCVLKALGYNKSDTINHFLPKHFHSLYISKIKKVIFLICDNLNIEETHIFLNEVRNKFRERGLMFDEYGEEFLEVYFLKWESIRQLNLHEIKLILKSMGQEILSEKLGNVLKGMSSTSPPINARLYNSRDLYGIKNTNIEKNEQLTISSNFSRCSINSDVLRKEHFGEENTRGMLGRSPSITSVDNQLRSNGAYNNPIGDSSTWLNLPLTQILNSPMNPPGNNVKGYQYNFEHMPEQNVATCLAPPNENSDYYSINPSKPGTILIIDQENFYTEIDPRYKDLLPKSSYKLDVRQGTDKDKEELKRVFEKFGFKVIEKHDLTHLDMIQAIKTTVNEVTDESSLFICIMSHGNTGVVYGSNSCSVQVTKIQEIMSGLNKANLTGKPKILILQCCQGQQCQKLDGIADDDEDSLSTDGPTTILRDMLTFWATIPGYAAIRNRKKGSWFIQALCKNMEEYGNRLHFADICTKVSGVVQNQVWDNGDEGKNAMTPLLESTLGKAFRLPQISK